MEKKITPRQELAKFVGNGNLRGLLEITANGLSDEAIELLINISSRYCEPKKRSVKKLTKL